MSAPTNHQIETIEGLEFQMSEVAYNPKGDNNKSISTFFGMDFSFVIQRYLTNFKF